VGYVPEDAPLYGHMRVDEFLTFMGRLRGLDGPRLARALALSRERLALDPVRSTIIARLSRGYRQRVSLAQALLHNPDLLVLDEPTNGLDPRQIIEFRGLLRAAAEHCAVIITSHILGEIERVADRAAILLDGRLLAVQNVGASTVLRIRVRADCTAQLRSILAVNAGVEEMVEEIAAEAVAGWRVRLSEPAARERLVSAVCTSGMAVVEVGETGSDLEASFLALTAEETRAA
jgi:ABC-2 type transport system ATP-binding protein